MHPFAPRGAHGSGSEAEGKAKQVVMAAINWSGKSGDWTTAADWVGGITPGSADTVTIAAPGAYTVTLTSADSASSLTVNDATATVAVNNGGTLKLGSTLALTAGTLQLNGGGTISGGILSATGGAFQWNGGVMAGVTYDGTLNLSVANDALTVNGAGLISKGVGGVGNGVININGAGSILDFSGTQTLNNATVNLGTAANSSYLSAVLDADPGANNGILTLGSGLAINQTNTYAGLGGGDNIGANDGGLGSILNDGAINATYSAGGFLQINPKNFTNAGKITVGDLSTLAFQTSGAFVNTAGATITALAGSTLGIGSPLNSDNGTDGAYSNAGTITATGATVDIYDPLSGSGALKISSSKVNLAYNLTTAQLTTFGGLGNSISVTGVLNNTGSTLSIGTGTALGTLALNAIINGGTINDMGSGWTPYDPEGAGGGVTFNGVTYNGAINFVGGVGSAIRVSGNGLILKGAGGVGNGTLNFAGHLDANITFDDARTFNNATLNINSTDAQLDVFQEDTTSTKYALTLGSNLILNQTGSIGFLDIDGGTIINEGIISAMAGGGRMGSSLSIGSNIFTNEGKLIASAGDTLSLNLPTDASTIGHQTGGSDFTNFAGGTLTGGSYEVDGESTMDLPNNQTLVTDDAVIILSGAGSVMQSINTTTRVCTLIETTLTTIHSAAALEILSARNYTTTNSIANSGTLQTGGGVFTSGILTDFVGSTLSGFGTVSSVFADSGVVTASGGALAFTGKGDTFAHVLSGTAIDFSGGTDLLKAGASLTAAAVGLSGGAVVTLGENLKYAGALAQGAGTSLAVGAYELVLTGAGSTLAGKVSGAGALLFDGGTQSVMSGASLAVSRLLILGGAAAAIDGSLSFAGMFEAEAGTRVAIGAGDSLDLTGAAVFSGGAVVDGGGTLSVSDTTLQDLAVGGTATLVDAHVIVQTGAVTLGDSQGGAATLTVDKGAIYKIVGDAGIARGASAGSTLFDDGVLDKASGAGVSAIGVAVIDAGVIEALAGTLDFTQAIGGAGTLHIYAGATLEADAGVAPSLIAVFNAASGTLALADAAGFAAKITGFAAGDAIDLIDTAATGATLEAGGKLAIVNGTLTVATLQLGGNYGGDTFTVSADGHGGSAITVTAKADAAWVSRLGQFAQAMAGLSGGHGSQANVMAQETRSMTTLGLAVSRL
ncbi:MAG: hypothetical protein ABI306_05955 [Caulobacteraceae bacterium]